MNPNLNSTEFHTLRMRPYKENVRDRGLNFEPGGLVVEALGKSDLPQDDEHDLPQGVVGQLSFSLEDDRVIVGGRRVRPEYKRRGVGTRLQEFAETMVPDREFSSTADTMSYEAGKFHEAYKRTHPESRWVVEDE